MLIHKDKNKYAKLEDYGLKRSPFVATMREVFDSKPNEANLRIFFKHPVIQYLWSEQHENPNRLPSFVSSNELRSALSEYEPAEKKKIYTHLEVVCPPGSRILP